MSSVLLDPITHDRLRLVAAAVGKTESETVAHLLDRLVGSYTSAPATAPAPDEPVPIHIVYRRHRIEALYDPTTEAVTITSGPLVNTTYDKPSPAARAVVELVAPSVDSHRNGWNVWTVTATGAPLQSIRP
jgi:hypothetical protein